MKICILICGLLRSLKLVINRFKQLFNKHFINVIIVLTNNSTNIDDNIITKKLYINDIYNDKYKNCLNYCNKICNGIKIIDNEYDIYIIVRSDLYLEYIDINNINNNNLYFSNKNMNEFIKNIEYKINSNIIITKNYNLLIKLIDLFNYAKNNINYIDIILYNYLNKYNINYNIIDINYKLILSECNIIAIAGDSGSGKTTLVNSLIPLYKDILTLETDRYHKWERGNENYNIYTHLNPNANHLEKLYDDVYNLKIGNDIYQVDYDHINGKFTQKQKILSKKNIIICGLHTLYDNKLYDIVNIKIYMDTDIELKKKWKLNRDLNERNYNYNILIKQINDRLNDYNNYIITQKNNADIIINFYEINNILKCNIYIQNKLFYLTIFDKIYDIYYKNDNIILDINDNINIDDDIFNDIYKDFVFNNLYYKHIAYILYNILFKSNK